jgi:hypothetical protein
MINIKIGQDDITKDIDYVSIALNRYRDIEYALAKYVPDNIPIIKPVICNSTYEIDKFKYSMQKPVKRKIYTPLINTHEKFGNYVNILNVNEDVFNIGNRVETTKWKDLPIEDKIVKLDIFYIYKYGNTNITDDIYNQLLDLINKNKLYSKQDIIYDRINSKIIELPLIKYNNSDSYYYIHHTYTKKKTKKIFK